LSDLGRKFLQNKDLRLFCLTSLAKPK